MILVQQCYKSAIQKSYNSVRIISDDTDVFALAVYHYPEEEEHLTVYMEPTRCGRAVTNIRETVQKHKEIVPFILQGHSISGCDSVARYHGIGKTTVVQKMMKKSFKGFIHFGNLDSKIEDVIEEATEFIGDCYGITSGKDMTEKR